MRAVNPVLRRELVERWRSRRAVVTLTAYLAVLGALLYLLYRAGQALLRAQTGFGPDAFNAGPLLGRFLVEALLFFVLLLVLFVAPGYAAAQLSGERERRTLPLLQVTLLRPRQIVLGKLGAATAWLALLVVAALPLGSAAFFLGGIALGDLLRGVAAILVVAVGVAGLAIGISSLTRRTTASVVLTYAAVLALTAGTLFLSGVELVVRAATGRQPVTPLALYANPFFALTDAVRAQGPSGFASPFLPSPLGIMAEALPGAPLVGGEPAMMQRGEAVVMAPGGPPVPEAVIVEPGGPPMPPSVVVDQPPAERGRRPVWLLVLGVYALLGTSGVVVATRRVATAPLRAPAPPTAAGPQPPATVAAGGQVLP